jgi:subtilisin family serine protease
MLIALIPLALAADPPPTRLSAALDQAAGLAGRAERLDWAARTREPYPDPERATAVLRPAPGVSPEALARAVRALDPGGPPPLVAGGLVQARLPVGQLGALDGLEGLKSARQPLLARPREVVSEGVAPIFVEDWAAEGLTGAGVRVAVLDVGFDGWEALVGEELTGPVTSRLEGEWDSTAHGTAVAEVIADIAPDAELYLYNFLTDVEFIDRLNTILADEIDVVNASVGFDNVWTMDGSSPWSQAVDQLQDYGVLYVAASGNEAENYARGALSDADGDGWAEIDGAQYVEVRVRGGYAEVSLRWSDDPVASGNDLDLYLLESDGDLCGVSQEVQDGDGFPYEVVECATNSAWLQAWIAVEGGSVQGLDGWIYTSAGVHSDQATPDCTLTLPADAAGALTVGAYDFETGEIAAYSSQGPTADGRIKPDLVAPTGVSTVTYGQGFFEGTSSSAPHVAGVAALLVQRRPGASPEKIRGWLAGDALDLGAPGPDNVFGEGAVQAGALPCGCSSNPRGAAPAWLALALAAALWRRR